MKKFTDLREPLLQLVDGEKVYDFLKNINENTKLGRHDFNENLYVNVVASQTKEGFDSVFESHKDFIDLHVMISGEEMLFYGHKANMVVTKTYDASGDYELLKGEEYSSVVCQSMQGVEFDVNEPHMALGAVKSPEKVLKAIVKIRK